MCPAREGWSMRAGTEMRNARMEQPSQLSASKKGHLRTSRASSSFDSMRHVPHRVLVVPQRSVSCRTNKSHLISEGLLGVVALLIGLKTQILEATRGSNASDHSIDCLPLAGIVGWNGDRRRLVPPRSAAARTLSLVQFPWSSRPLASLLCGRLC